MSYRSVQSISLALLLLASPCALCDDDSFHVETAAIRHRYRELENRKNTGAALSAAEDKERQCLLGQLIDRDPVVALNNDIAADMHALRSSPRPEDHTTADKLVEFLQITIPFEGRATTAPEAKSLANQLRQFVVRRDVEGARAWVKAQ